MRNIILTTTLLVSLSVNAQEKTHDHQSSEFGLKAGMNIAMINIPDFDSRPRLSAYAGGFSHLHLSEHFAFQPEIVFSGQGTRYTSVGKNYVSKLTYVNLPLLLQLMFSGFRIETGPQVGGLLSARLHEEGGGNANIKSNYKKLDLAWVFGLSYISKSRLGMNVRYNYGLSNINNISPSPKITNSVIQAGLFFQFRNK